LYHSAQVADSPEFADAKAGIEKLKTLAAAGAIPRMQVERAEQQLADAEDAAVLRRTLYGQDLTAEQSDEMVAAAERRLARREKGLDEAKGLVEAGAASPASLGTFMAEIDSARKETELAAARAKLTRELAEMARAEESLNEEDAEPSTVRRIAERFDGDGIFNTARLTAVEKAFIGQFGKALPVSAKGETAVHRSLGFDHRGRVDVALTPDQPEGAWLRQYLTDHKIPFFAFRQAVPGKATGAHFHLGPMSTRYKLGG
jgi:hypothetical protein